MITVENDHSKKNFCVLYKAPSMNQDPFFVEFGFLTSWKIFCGDVNVDILVNSSFLAGCKFTPIIRFEVVKQRTH